MMPFPENGKIAVRVGVGILALVGLLGVFASAQSRSQSPSPGDLKKKFSEMAPIDEYLMERDAEIALARSAAPEAISKNATVLVLTRHGWETAVKGTNGFVCNVERGWTGSIDFAEIWNPRIKGPDCLNAAAARSILPIEYKITQMTLAGDSKQQRLAGIREAFAKKELPALEPGAMGFMMSKGAYLSDSTPHNFPHLMIYTRMKEASDWGVGMAHVPIASSSYWFPGGRNPEEQGLPTLRLFFVAVPKWSDGTDAWGK